MISKLFFINRLEKRLALLKNPTAEALEEYSEEQIDEMTSKIKKGLEVMKQIRVEEQLISSDESGSTLDRRTFGRSSTQKIWPFHPLSRI